MVKIVVVGFCEFGDTLKGSKSKGTTKALDDAREIADPFHPAQSLVIALLNVNGKRKDQ